MLRLLIDNDIYKYKYICDITGRHKAKPRDRMLNLLFFIYT